MSDKRTFEPKPHQVLRFNISGKTFEVSKSTIASFCRARKNVAVINEHEQPKALERDSLGGEDEGLLESADGYLPESGEYFFQRSPEVFQSLLLYSSSGVLHWPQGICSHMVLEELSFWKIDPSYVAKCCSHLSREGLALASLQPDYRNFSQLSPNFDPMNPVSLTEETKGFDSHIQKQRLLKDKKITDQFSDVWGESFRRGMWKFLEHPESSLLARLYGIVTVSIVITSIAALVMDSMEEFRVCVEKEDWEREVEWKECDSHPAMLYVEGGCIVWFSVEYVVHLLISGKKLHFLKTPMNVIDLLSIFPFYIELSLNSADLNTEKLKQFQGAMISLRILRVVRVVRIFKLAKYCTELQYFATTMKESKKEISLLALVLIVNVVIFSTAVYFFEKDVENTKFTSIPASCWWAIVTMTTVGYGEITPQTVGGKLVASVTSLSGVIVVAFPITVIVENFQKQYKGEDEKARRHLQQHNQSTTFV